LTFDDAGEIADVLKALGRIATEVHPRIMKAYADGEFRHRVILSGGGTFLIGLAAACGYVRKRIMNKRQRKKGHQEGCPEDQRRSPANRAAKLGTTAPTPA